MLPLLVASYICSALLLVLHVKHQRMADRRCPARAEEFQFSLPSQRG